jgi:hypothetical protein
MALKRIPAIGKIMLKEADGSPLMAEADGSQSWARGYTPSSKFWENAMAERRRKVRKRVREAGGKLDAADETTEDKVAFLETVITELSPGVVEGIAGDMKQQISAVLRDTEIGYIRDQLDAAEQDWGSFLETLESNSPSGSVSQPG